MTHEETKLAVLAAWERWPERADFDNLESAISAFFLSFKASFPGIIHSGNFQSPNPIHAVRYWCLEHERERALRRERETGHSQTG